MADLQALERLIVFEGIDGAGTTTQARLLVERIRNAGDAVWATSEPTDGPIGNLLRRVLAGDVRVSPETAAFLFASDRWEHVFGSGGIVEHHGAGDIVVCDRYVYSSLVYQTIHADEALVRQLNGRFPAPALVIFVDLDPGTSEQRLSGRANREIYEYEEFQREVHARYLSELRSAGQTTEVVTVSGAENEAEVHRNIWEAVGKTSILEI